MSKKGNQGGRGGADISKIVGRGVTVSKVPGPPSNKPVKVKPQGGRGVNDISEIVGSPFVQKPPKVAPPNPSKGRQPKAKSDGFTFG